MIIKVVGAFIAIVTFAILLETPRKYLWCAGVVGGVGWLAYLLSTVLDANEILATFISACGNTPCRCHHRHGRSGGADGSGEGSCPPDRSAPPSLCSCTSADGRMAHPVSCT